MSIHFGAIVETRHFRDFANKFKNVQIRSAEGMRNGAQLRSMLEQLQADAYWGYSNEEHHNSAEYGFNGWSRGVTNKNQWVKEGFEPMQAWGD